MTIGTRLFTWATGKHVGDDEFGNRYFTERSPAKGRRTKRWVLFAGPAEASTIPAEWHAWLHYTVDQPLLEEAKAARAWQKKHQANQTGGDNAYLPPGHDLRGGNRERATGDYEAWQP